MIYHSAIGGTMPLLPWWLFAISMPPMATAEKFLVRFTDDMRSRLAEAAEQNRRSMNQEIIARLRATFDDVPPLEARVAKLEEAVFKKARK